MIDLRSDTVTRPSPAMREVMASAPVGDDVLGDDPTVIRLEARVAEMLGKEDAVYVPTGTMSNQIAFRTHTEPGDMAIMDGSSYDLSVAVFTGSAHPGQIDLHRHVLLGGAGGALHEQGRVAADGGRQMLAHPGLRRAGHSEEQQRPIRGEGGDGDLHQPPLADVLGQDNGAIGQLTTQQVLDHRIAGYRFQVSADRVVGIGMGRAFVIESDGVASVEPIDETGRRRFLVEQGARVFRVELLDNLGRAFDIGEDDRHLLTFALERGTLTPGATRRSTAFT